MCIHACTLSHSVVSDSLWPYGLYPGSLSCSWDSPAKNTGVDCHSLFQGIFLIQDRTQVSCIAGRFITVWTTWKAHYFLLVNIHRWWFPGGSVSKEFTWNAGGSGSIPWRREWLPTPVFLAGESHGQRSLVGYSPLHCKRVRHDLGPKPPPANIYIVNRFIFTKRNVFYIT